MNALAGCSPAKIAQSAGSDARRRVAVVGNQAITRHVGSSWGEIAHVSTNYGRMLMTRRSTIWLAVAVLFMVGNVAGAVMAAVQGELLHAAGHAALTLLGAYIAQRIWYGGQPVIAVVPDTSTDRLTQLEQSIDAVAIEVERVGEGQRRMTQLFTERSAPVAPVKRAADP